MIPRTEGFITSADGERLWYETAGTGPDLVLCHGLGGNAAVWYQQVPYFAEHYRVTTWDQRGFGRSTNHTGKHGPQSAVVDLEAILNHVGVERADVVGQSMGGWAALGLALAAPERVRSVVLASTTGGIPVRLMLPPTPPPDDPAPDADAGADPGAMPARPLGAHPAIGDRLPGIDLARAYLYQALGSFGSRPPDAEFFRLLATTMYDADAVRGLDLPVLLLAGELDELMTPAIVREAAGFLAHPTVVEFAGRGHSAYFEDPDAWNETVSHFLTNPTTNR